MYWVLASDLLLTSFGTLAKAQLTKKGYDSFLIDKESVETIKDLLSTNE